MRNITFALILHIFHILSYSFITNRFCNILHHFSYCLLFFSFQVFNNSSEKRFIFLIDKKVVSVPPDLSLPSQTEFRVPIGTKQFRLICPVKDKNDDLLMIQWKKNDEPVSPNCTFSCSNFSSLFHLLFLSYSSISFFSKYLSNLLNIKMSHRYPSAADIIYKST